MTAAGVSSFLALALAQIIFYKIGRKQSIKQCWVLAGIYILIFLVLRIPGVLFLNVPFVLFALLFAGSEFAKRSRAFKTRLSKETDFYLHSAVWACVILTSFRADGVLWSGGLKSLLAALLLPLLAGLNERLELLDAPKQTAGLPVLLVAAGFLLLGLLGLLQSAF